MVAVASGLIALAYRGHAPAWKVLRVTLEEAARQQRISAHHYHAAQMFPEDHDWWTRRMERSAAHARLARRLMGMRE